MSSIKVDTLTGKTTAKTVTVTVGATATQSMEQGLAKAFGSFAQNAYPDTGYTNNQAGETFNFSSITDVSSGSISCSLSNNTSSTTYCGTGTTCYFATGSSSAEMEGIFSKTTSSFGMGNAYANGNVRDANYTGILLHGSLA